MSITIKGHCFFLFLFYYTFVFLSSVEAQQAAVSARFEKDTIAVQNNQTFANRLLLINQTNKIVELLSDADGTKTLEGLIRLPQKIILQPKEERAFPLKYIADRQTINQAVQSFNINLTAADQSIQLPKVSFCTVLKIDHALLLQLDQTAYYLDQVTGRSELLLRTVNTGLIPLTVQLRLSGLPMGLELVGETFPMTIAPGGQEVSKFTITARSKKVMGDAELQIVATNADGAVLATNRVRILTVGSVKRFGMDNGLDGQLRNNTLALRYVDMDHGLSVQQVQGFGSLNLGEEAKLDYRLNVDYYKKQQALNVYDTYVDVKTKHWGLKLGNIYDNLDQSINGRGLKASYLWDKGRSISLYRVDNSYMLLSQLNNLIPGGKIWGLSYQVRSDLNQESSISYLHNDNAYRGVNSDQINGKGYFRLSEKQLLNVEGGYSFERLVGSRLNNQALAIGLSYHASFGSYQLTSINYYSSPYYAGLRRGVLQTDSRISRTVGDRQSLSARLSYLDNNPAYLMGDRNAYFNYGNRIQIYELGYHRDLGRFKLDLRPYWMVQRSTDLHVLLGSDLMNTAPLNASAGVSATHGIWESSAVRVVTDLNFFNAAHRFSLRTDYGYTYRNTSGRPMAPFQSVRINGGYNYGVLGVNAFVQINPYYVTDAASLSQMSDYRVYSIGPNVQWQAFGNRLQTQASTMYSYYGASRSNNFSINGSLSWKAKGNWKFTADIYYTLMHATSLPLSYENGVDGNNMAAVTSYVYNNKQVRLGIEKGFGGASSIKGHSLELFLFEDNNNNGTYEVGELLGKGVLVRIGEEVAVADARGRVKFLAMAKGNYTVLIENNQGWVSQGALTVALSKNQRLEVPLVKTRIVKGGIKVVRNRYMDTNPSLAGIRLNAVSKEGKVYTTLSDVDGNYVFYLPMGGYRVSVVTEGMAFSIDNPACEVVLDKQQLIQLSPFMFRDERRKMEVKRF